MMGKVLISMVAYNEEKTIGDVIVRVRKVMESINEDNQIYYDILVVDDGSTDKTGEIAKKSGAKVVRHFINLGPGQALKTSYLYAIKKGYDLVVRLDADGQHPPEYIPHLLEPILRGEADVVIGSRYLDGSYKSSFLRDFGNLAHSKLLSLISRQRLTDITSGFRAIKIDAIKDIVEYDYPSTPAVYITLKEALLGYKIKEIPVKMYPRRHGRSYLNLRRLLLYPFKTIYTVVKTFMEG